MTLAVDDGLTISNSFGGRIGDSVEPRLGSSTSRRTREKARIL